MSNNRALAAATLLAASFAANACSISAPDPENPTLNPKIDSINCQKVSSDNTDVELWTKLVHQRRFTISEQPQMQWKPIPIMFKPDLSRVLDGLHSGIKP